MNPLIPTWPEALTTIFTLAYIVVLVACVIGLLRDDLLTAPQRLAWLMVIVLVPGVGLVAYLTVRRKTRTHCAQSLPGSHLE